MSRQKFNSVVLFWLITVFSILLAYFTYIVKNISLESEKGTLVFGFLLFLYLCWFIYDTFVSNYSTSLIDAVKFNLTRNPAIWSMYCYWAAFLVLPIIYALFCV